MKIILFFFEHSKRAIIFSAVAGIISGISNAALLAVVNVALKAGNARSSVIWIFAALCVTLPLARFTSELLLTKLGQESMHALRMKLCRQVLSTPLQHLEVLGPSRILTSLMDDISSIAGALTALPVICINVALVVGCLAYMATLSWLLFGLVAVFLVLGIALYQLPVARMQNIFMKARQNAESLLENLRALTFGAKELKIHSARRNAFLHQHLNASSRSFMANNISALRLYSAASSWGQTLVFVVIGIYLFVLSPLGQFGAGTVTGYTLALLYLMSPLQVIMNSLPQLARANVALQRVQEMGFTLTSQRSEEISETGPLSQPWSLLELKAVTHTYKRENESEKFLLGPVDLVFEAGKLVFIAGGNGSGKTTLIKVLTGLYMLEQGSIFLDGEPVVRANIEWYRQHFSVIFSDYFLFEHLLGIETADVDECAREYLNKLRLSHKVSITDGRLSTLDLSQGQRKRLALLTAYMEDRPIYIFDEWAADQDPYFKDIFYLQLLPELRARNKTVFVISHDDRYYHLADRLIRLEDGQVTSDVTGIAVSPLVKECSVAP